MVHESFEFSCGRLVKSSGFKDSYRMFRACGNGVIDSAGKSFIVVFAIPAHTDPEISFIASIWLWLNIL